MGVTASYDGGELCVRRPDGSVASGSTQRCGEPITVDYRGRDAAFSAVDCPWAEAFSALLGHDVVLAEVERPGEVVFGGPVVLLTTSSLAEVARRVGGELAGAGLLEDSERFRSSVVVASDRTEVNARGREVVFGLDADMVTSGTVAVGDIVQGS